ncbi:MAG: cytokinesis protein 3 [Caeruleum heppii]|nr:MAG: cytokinesis protein 3 [Caeruleum heppii]
MPPAAPGLPTRFPCWCRATYSWGGETKRDLGFIEGDLIECLNAGDGSWWMGRLRRDKRMVGLFPSNFVQVLDDSFQPASRAASPMPSVQDGGSRAPSPNPMTALRGPSPRPSQKSPAKSFRRPFAAYARGASPNPTAHAREMESRSRASSPHTPTLSRETSGLSREPSGLSSPGMHGSYNSRAPSPALSFQCRRPSRCPSPNPNHDTGSSPPPPAPPPHRVAYRPKPAQSPSDPYYDLPAEHYTPRPSSAAPTSPSLLGHTPPGIRDAMDDVMSSLQGMGMAHEEPSSQHEKPSSIPWSAEAFDLHHARTSSRQHTRPRTSLGIGGQVDDEYNEVDDGASQFDNQQHEPPGLDNYVERMERRLRSMQSTSARPPDELFLPAESRGGNEQMAPAMPAKHVNDGMRPSSALDRSRPGNDSVSSRRKLRNRKSAYELGREMLGRTFTTRSSVTTASSGVQSTTTNGTQSTQLTSQSVMSGHSAGGFSATSAGSLARRRGVFGSIKGRPMSALETRKNEVIMANGHGIGSEAGRPPPSLTGVTYHSSHDSNAGARSQTDWNGTTTDSAGGVLGGLTAPKPKKSGFFKKIIESAKTGAANARSSIAAGQMGPPPSPTKNGTSNGVTGISGGSAAADMGLGGGGGGGSTIDWVQVRRDVNRSNSLSRNERVERQERCQMMDYPVLNPVDMIYETTQGDEGADGHPVEQPIDFQAVNFTLVDKNTRFVNSLPPMTNPASLAQGYVCRPYRSDVQRLRAIFTWVSEKISWEEDFEGEIDTRRVIQLKRGCAEEVAVLVMEMCAAIGLHAEVVRGYLKTPGGVLEMEILPHPNHWWNAVVVDGEWRLMDCALASPTNPKRGQYSTTNSATAEMWWFLARPTELCHTHVPSLPDQQHIVPPLHHDILMALPCACPPYFKHGLQMVDFDTSLMRIEELELVHVQFSAPCDVECVAEVEARAFERDADGDFFESGEVVRKRALAQAEWVGGQKKFTVKALLPGDEGQGVLKVYAGKRGLMHSIKDNPHPLAFALPIIHTGQNPPYEFLTRHPTPHAQRHDLYVAQPQCARLAVNNTFVFAVRQHPSSLASTSGLDGGTTSPVPFARPGSAMSMTSSSASGSAANGSNTYSQKKPAKLAIQAPSGKILRLMRKSEHTISTSGPGGGEAGDGGIWETIIKCGERGVWRGLVLADRSARWCVFAEWTCV